MKEFNFSKTYEEFKIGGKVYKIEMNDKAIISYRKAMDEYANKAKKLESAKVETIEQSDKLFKEAIDMARKLVDLLLGKGAFDELYEASGESTEQMAIMIEWLGQLIVEKTALKKQDKLKKYTK